MAPDSPSAEAATLVVRTLLARPTTLGRGRLLCIDGPAGSGKTTLAQAVAALLPVQVIHMDDLYDGWRGLPDVHRQLETLTRPLASGESGAYRRYDWHRGRYAETVEVPPVDVLLIEGVGSGSSTIEELITLLVWVESDQPTRLRRGLARDGENRRNHWRRWQELEQDHLRREKTRDRAALRFDGDGVPIVDP